MSRASPTTARIRGLTVAAAGSRAIRPRLRSRTSSTARPRRTSGLHRPSCGACARPSGPLLTPRPARASPRAGASDGQLHRVSDVAKRIEELRRAGLERKLRLIEGPQGPRVLMGGTEVMLLCSNNYLGLADHPGVRRAAAEAAERFGAGAGASRLISGTRGLHRKLERRLAEFEGTEAALVFGSGYLANAGTVASLAGRGDVVFSDELNH